MTQTDIEAGFKIWRDEAATIERSHLPDAQVPIIALAGIYSVLTSEREQKTSYAWRQTVLSSRPTCEVLVSILDDMQQDYFDETYDVSLEDFKLKPGKRISWQERFELAAVLDGVPDGVTTIRGDEHFLAKTLGHSIHNFAVSLNPLKLQMDSAAPALDSWFPETLDLIESHHP
jgi:hypothetical protein